ncbi:hypothetical protein Back2_19610 [Nocardioides baekrokdamisoli]|uniref:Uncharacterized protein n=1 Tax=Nocardioides baekrokdamisoli TaxID=1804624 RepID=A0A3G9J2K2_9ACTN|nr:hypothetical protein [Nocardioides baekrokdamisoli]BBH17674.1 hypothetical protein Back2_19610 [Nocardioides baekrokdamisoli]
MADHSRLGRGWRAHEGRWHPIALEPGQPCHGYATDGGREFLALYVTGGTIWLQSGSRAWDCATIDTVTQISATLRTTGYELRFADGSTERIRVRIPMSVAMRRVTDARFDVVDTWWDDLIRLLPLGSAGHVSEWAVEEYARWSAGFPHTMSGARL